MKKILLTLMVAISFTIAKGAPKNLTETERVAANFITQITRDCGTPNLVYTAKTADKGMDCFRIYNINNGFIIVSADDRIRPILGYSTESTFDPQNIPDNVQSLLNSYIDEITAVYHHVAADDTTMRAEWQILENGLPQHRQSDRSVSELLTDNNWQQNNGYNYYCPADNSGPAGHCYVGCCALSMGQVMHYWQHPSQGIGSHSYECNHSTWGSGQYGDYGTLSANFEATTYNYAMMPNNLNSSTPSNQILAIAKLLYHCGIAIEIWYGSAGTMGFHDDIGAALETYFKYDETLTVWKNNYNGDWDDLLRSDLDLGRPIIYCAYANEGGHEFVCDGYDNNNCFHFNMGWGGYYNGYYATGNLNAQYNFNSSHGAVMHIHPIEQTPDAIEDKDFNITIGPNPTQDWLYIEGENIHEIALYDMMGRELIRRPCLSQTVHEINLSNYATGTYLLQLRRDGETHIRKIIKQ